MGLFALLPVAAAFLIPAISAQDANSTGINATATLQSKLGVAGTFTFSTDPDSEVVHVKYDITGLDKAAEAGGNSSFQFLYHIHTNPVPADGNCTKTLGHLDPLNLTDAVVCDPQAPQFCQEGDLSGKHGKLAAQGSVSGDYDDAFLRFWPEPLSIFGRSVVVHYPNKTRIACGNITSFVDGTADQDGKPTNASSNYVTNYPAAASPQASGPFSVSLSTAEGGSATAAYADNTQLPALPDVSSVPNGVLSTGASNVPTVAAASSSFAYSGQPISAFPTQSESAFPSASPSGGASGSSSAASPSASNSGAEKVSMAFGFVAGGAVAGFALVASLI